MRTLLKNVVSPDPSFFDFCFSCAQRALERNMRISAGSLDDSVTVSVVAERFRN